MNNACRRDGWHCDEFEHRAAAIWPHDQQPVLAVELLHSDSNSVLPGMEDVRVRNTVLAGAREDLHMSTIS